jgi:CDP-diacylglycerol---serine O-phosphatidyltransferase
MPEHLTIPKRVTALLVYLRPPLVFGGLLCAIAVMWSRNPTFYVLGVVLLFVAMCFDLVDGWFSARFDPNDPLAQLADRLMDRVVYSIIFPLVAVGVMWRLTFISPHYTKNEHLHAIFLLLLCVTVLVRDSFSHFMRGFGIRQGQEPEASELNRLRTMVATPVGAILYAYAFYVPEGPPSKLYFWISWLGNIPLGGLFLIEILFLIINFGSIAGYCRKYGNFCLEEVCLGDVGLRRRILSFFPNALTAMNAMMGLLSVFFAYQDRIREAYLILIGAALFDKLDGSLARKLGLTKPSAENTQIKRFSVGGILDDISDAVSFCVVPAWIFYVYMASVESPFVENLPIGIVAWAYAISGFARLAYFTLDQSPIPGFFKGMPTPAGALLVIAPLLIFDQTMIGTGMFKFWGSACVGLMAFAAMAMNIYPIRYIHYGRFMSRHPVFVSMTMLVGIIFVFTPYFGYFSLFCMSIYLISPAWTWRVLPEVAARE